MAANWALGAGGGFQNALATGLQIGQGIRQQRQQDEDRNLLMQQRQQQMQQREREQQRDAIPVTLNMLRAATPENWQGLRQRAIQMGIPGAQSAPEQYDQNWVGSTVQELQAFSTPQGWEAASTAGKEAMDAGFQPGTPEFSSFVRQRLTAGDRRTIPLQPGGSVAEYDPATGQARLVVAPNTGAMPAGAPAGSGEAPATKTIGGKTYYNVGGKWYDEPMGGGSGNATGGF